MRPALLVAGLAAAIAVATCAAIAQPVAKLEVVKSTKATPSQHDRIEQKLDAVLEALKAAPPKPPAPPVVVTPPTPPTTPVDPPPPAGPNPFIAWRAQGYDLVGIQVFILRRPLTPAEVEQAYAAGYPRPDAPTGNGGPAQGAANDLSDGAVKHFGLSAGEALTVTFNRSGTVRVIGASGTQIRSLTDEWGTRSLVGSTGWYDRAFSGPGSYTFSMSANGRDIAVQLVQ